MIAIRVSVLLAVAAIVQLGICRRTSAATRHMVWTLAIAGMLLLPLLSLALPQWAIVNRATARAADNRPPVTRVTEAAPVPLPAPGVEPAAVTPEHTSTPPGGLVTAGDTFPWALAVPGLYAFGVLMVLIQLAIERRSVRRLAREAVRVRDPEWTQLLLDSAARMGLDRPVRLLRSRHCRMPMAFGTLRPAILIPAVADTWPEDRRRAVVLHELAHLARYDCLTQSLALVTCALYWFHPAVWWVARRLRIERERACDDRVLAAGTGAREYAGHLLEIAYAFGSGRAPALAVSMARPRQLEGRLLAVLNTAINRSVPPWRMRAAGAAIVALLLLPIATATSAAPQQDTTTAQAAAFDVLLSRSAGRIVRAAAAAFGVSQDRQPGTWEIRPSDTEGMVHLRLVELNSSSGNDIPVRLLDGLTEAQRTGAGGPVQFRLRRDAGTFTFEGVFRGGVGAGTFSFTLDPNFPAELAKRGFARPTALEQYQLARHDIGYAFLDELTRQGYAKPETSDLVRAGQHGVQLTYLHDMGALGYRLGSLAPLIELRDHGVTPDYVRGLADQGYKGLSADGLRQARDHGVSTEYVRAMREAGYGSLPMEALINARDHGVSPDFVRGLADAGYRGLPLDQLIRVRDHGVSAEYARGMRELGYSVAIEDLIRARDHGADLEFVRGMTTLGYRGLPLDALIQARDHGVTPKFVQDLNALGYDRVALDDVVTLRDHGLTAERIRAANARAGTRLSIDALRGVR